jgi:hypothetical protein
MEGSMRRRMALRERGRRKVAIATAVLAFMAVAAGGATGAAMAVSENSGSSTTTNGGQQSSGSDQLQAPGAVPGSGSGSSDVMSGGS